MSEVNLKEIYAGMQQEMLGKLQVGAMSFVHPGTMGDNSEANWIDWFKNYLPKRYKVAKGIIIDSAGNQSHQIDLVIYDAQYSYLVFNQGDSKLIPAESVYAIFEVKQDLNKTHIEYAGEKAKSVRSLYRTSAPIKYAKGEYPPKPLHEILAGVLTTRSAWVDPIVSNTVKYIKERSYEEHLDFVCSISNNTFVVENNTFVSEYDSSQTPIIRFCEKDESLVFLLLNLLRRLQDIGTVPAIDYSKYAEKIDSKIYKQT